MKTPNEMTAAECAEWCALDDGWRPCIRKEGWHSPKHDGSPGVCDCDGFMTSRVSRHRFPVTIDGAVGALQMPMRILELRYFYDTPNKWTITAYPAIHVTLGGTVMFCYEVSGPDEITARYRLAVACRQPLKESHP